MSAVRIVTIEADELREMIRAEVRAALEMRGAEAPAAPRAAGSYLSVAAAAQRAGCSRTTIYTWLRTGRLRRRRVGAGRGHYRIAVEDLDRAMDASTQAPQVDPEALADQILQVRRIG